MNTVVNTVVSANICLCAGQSQCQFFANMKHDIARCRPAAEIQWTRKPEILTSYWILDYWTLVITGLSRAYVYWLGRPWKHGYRL